MNLCTFLGHKEVESDFCSDDSTIFKGAEGFYCPRCQKYFVRCFDYSNDAIWLEPMTNQQIKYFNRKR